MDSEAGNGKGGKMLLAAFLTARSLRGGLNCFREYVEVLETTVEKGNEKLD